MAIRGAGLESLFPREGRRRRRGRTQKMPDWDLSQLLSGVTPGPALVAPPGMGLQQPTVGRRLAPQPGRGLRVPADSAYMPASGAFGALPQPGLRGHADMEMGQLEKLGARGPTLSTSDSLSGPQPIRPTPTPVRPPIEEPEGPMPPRSPETSLSALKMKRQRLMQQLEQINAQIRSLSGNGDLPGPFPWQLGPGPGLPGVPPTRPTPMPTPGPDPIPRPDPIPPWGG